jgi:small subunit ribosomal protein S20
MAHSASAKKRIRQNETRRARNRWRKGRIKDSVKQFLTAVHEGDLAQAQSRYDAAARTLDKIAATGTIHKNAAARKKSRLARRLNALKSGKAAGGA